MARARFAALLPLGAQDAGDGGPDAPATTTSAAQIIVEPSDDAQALLTSIRARRSRFTYYARAGLLALIQGATTMASTRSTRTASSGCS